MCMYTHTHTRTHTHQAAASTPGHEDANLMTAAISFFVLLGTIGYWMFLRSKKEARRAKWRREKVGLPATATDAELEQREAELENQKAELENQKALLQGARDGDTHKVASLIKAGTDVGCKDSVRVCACVVVSILCMRMCACARVCL